jgi:hypothetical protein
MEIIIPLNGKIIATDLKQAAYAENGGKYAFYPSRASNGQKRWNF